MKNFHSLSLEMKFLIFEHIHFDDYETCLFVFRDFDDYINDKDRRWRIAYENFWRSHDYYLSGREVLIYNLLKHLGESYRPLFRVLIQNKCDELNHYILLSDIRDQLLDRNYFGVFIREGTNYISIDDEQLTTIVRYFVIYKLLDRFYCELPGDFIKILEYISSHPQTVETVCQSKKHSSNM